MSEKNAAPAWFQTTHTDCPLRTVAYFSMEYMLRGPAHLLWRPWECRRPSVEGRKRAGCSRGRHRAPLSAGVFPAGARCQLRPTRPLSRQRTRPIALYGRDGSAQAASVRMVLALLGFRCYMGRQGRRPAAPCGDDELRSRSATTGRRRVRIASRRASGSDFVGDRGAPAFL